jgi:hypothetical protein
MLHKVKESGYIKGLGKFEEDNLITLNFIDDTLLFLTIDTRIIDALKLLLVGFENLSR